MSERQQNEVVAPTFRPAFAPIDGWMAISGMGRRAVYAALDRGDLRAKKMGARTMIDVEHGLAWLRALPDYDNNRRATPRRSKPAESHAAA